MVDKVMYIVEHKMGSLVVKTWPTQPVVEGGPYQEDMMHLPREMNKVHL